MVGLRLQVVAQQIHLHVLLLHVVKDMSLNRRLYRNARSASNPLIYLRVQREFETTLYHYKVSSCCLCYGLKTVPYGWASNWEHMACWASPMPW
jgi:hypothetical protein